MAEETDEENLPCYNRIADELNNWIEKIDREYRNILSKHGFGENIIFIEREK